ncbi:MAG: hypothetical protein QM785_02145 [Pyrinomonadaceae bacterium]
MGKNGSVTEAERFGVSGTPMDRGTQASQELLDSDACGLSL